MKTMFLKTCFQRGFEFLKTFHLQRKNRASYKKFKKYDIPEFDFGTFHFIISILVLVWNLALQSYYGDKK